MARKAEVRCSSVAFHQRDSSFITKNAIFLPNLSHERTRFFKHDRKKKSNCARCTMNYLPALYLLSPLTRDLWKSQKLWNSWEGFSSVLDGTGDLRSSR